MRQLSTFVALLISSSLFAAEVHANSSANEVSERACKSIAGRVDAEPGDGPIFLRSFDGEQGKGGNGNVALATAAFTYDNALATIALVACGSTAKAERIGKALALAATHDRAGRLGRLRNAYRSGPQSSPPPPNGWWDDKSKAWLEDGYQVGTSTGNVAWAALALLTLSDATGDSRYKEAAAHLASWTALNVRDTKGAGGFTGGIYGGEATPQALTWKATEHNVDLEAVFLWLVRSQAPGTWAIHAKAARAFINSQWDKDSGHFLTGTKPDGITPNRVTSGLDAQLWPLLLPDAPKEWTRAIGYAERVHGVPGGFAFNNDRSGLWTEGTAQAALSYQVIGQRQKAEAIFGQLAGLFSPGGYLWATPEQRVTTGLAISPDSPTADFFYFHLPHLGATAWAAIASKGWNPFIGRPLKSILSPSSE